MDRDVEDTPRYRSSTGGTNRPPHTTDSTMDSIDQSIWSPQLSHDATMQNITDLGNLSRLRRSLQQPPSTTSQDSVEGNFRRPLPKGVRPPHKARSISPSSTTSSSIDIHMASPPRTIPLGQAPSSLAGTPMRDAARILTENVFQTAGYHSSDDDSSEIVPTRGNNKRAKTDKAAVDSDANAGKAWDETNIMEVDDPESRAKFDNFLQQRQNRRIDLNEELPTWGQTANSPSNRSSRFEPPLANTPTTDRVLEGIMAADLQQEQADYDGAYEFSDAMPHDKFEEYQAKDKQSMSGSDLTFHSGSNITMVSGSTGQIPAKFDLQYFPQKFRIPPASGQLTRIYNYFAERPGSMLTINDVFSHLDEISVETIGLLINLLTRKRFLKKVGNKEAWTIRR